jgi:hypothetical protein
MTTAEMLEQIEIELFGWSRADKHAELHAEEVDRIVDVWEYAHKQLASRTGFRGDKIS